LDEGAECAVRPDQIGQRGVVDEVVGVLVRAVGRFRIDGKGAFDGGDLLARAGQADEARVEIGKIVGDYLGRVAQRIDGDEDRLDRVAVMAEQFEGLGQAQQGHRADIGALRIAEEDQRETSAQVGIADRAAMMIGELEAAADTLR
jgi:hypothetical protein